MFEREFTKISHKLYDTDVPMRHLDEDITPFLDEHITFKDPWQRGEGIENYRLGLAGFHSMMKFKLDITQVCVHLEKHATTGRAMVDSVMHLKPFALIPSYPLRTILTYTFRLTPEDANAPFKITGHEEMWSFGDMLQAVPLAGKFYDHIFRPGFAKAFLGASYLSAKRKGNLPEAKTP